VQTGFVIEATRKMLSQSTGPSRPAAGGPAAPS
jgi:hypothetical protein